MVLGIRVPTWASPHFVRPTSLALHGQSLAPLSFPEFISIPLYPIHCIGLKKMYILYWDCSGDRGGRDCHLWGLLFVFVLSASDICEFLEGQEWLFCLGVCCLFTLFPSLFPDSSLVSLSALFLSVRSGVCCFFLFLFPVVHQSARSQRLQYWWWVKDINERQAAEK